ncbi:hypothetical protein HY251_18925 [bacterium]|nr:hypothetical protein [bacterium]
MEARATTTLRHRGMGASSFLVLAGRRVYHSSTIRDVSRRTSQLELPGLLALGFYGVNAAYYFHRGEPWNALWICHLSCVWIGLGLMLRSPALNAIGLLWLSYGFPLWVYYLIFEGDLRATSACTHVGGMSAALLGVRELGIPRGTWRKAIAGILVLQQVCRMTTPAPENVNMSAGVWAGFERCFFSSYAVFFAANLVATALIFSAIERAGERWIARVTPRDGGPPA